MPRFANAVDLAKNELQNARVQNLAVAPSSPVTGQIYYDTDDNRLWFWNGTAWTAADGGSPVIGPGTITTTEILDGTILDIDINASAGIALSKLATDPLARANHTGTQAPATITFAATDRLLGRDTAAGGPGEELTVTGGLEFTGTGIQRSALTGDVTASAGSGTTAIASNAVTYAKMQDVLTDTLIGRDTAATGDPEAISVTGGIVFTGTGGIQTTAFTGDVTKALGGTALTIANSVVTNAKLANMPANSFKGNNTGGAGAALDLTVAQAKTLLAYAGTDVTFTPAQNIAATNVQAAIEEAVTDLTALITTQIEARTWKDPVDAATTAALPALTYASGPGTLTATANAALAAQDGVTLAVGEDLLVKNQASTFQNGIYTVTQVGSGVAPFILTRRADCNTAVELRDATVMVEGGTTQKGDIWTQTASALADLTAAAQAWAQTGEGNTTYTADTTTIELVGNSFRIATGAAGNGLTGGGGAALAVGAGAGITVAADTVSVDTATVVRKHAATIGDGVATSIAVTHNLGTRDVTVAVYAAATPYEEVWPTVQHTDTNTVTLLFAAAPTTGQYRAVVHA